MTGDGYGWLEEVDGERALAWVRERNAESPDVPTRLRAELLEVLDSDDRIPMPGLREGHLYNFWRDESHPRGLWRRTTLASYRTERPDWEVLLDLDRLAADEGENWVWQSASVLRPDCRRALLWLSRGGADAAVVREYDLVERAFVADGFTLPEAKSYVAWRDLDTVYVGTDTGPGSLTDAGFPRTVRLWRRGTPVADAPVIFAGEPGDVGVVGWRDHTPGYERDFVVRQMEFFAGHTYLIDDDGTLRQLRVPDDADVQAHGAWALIRPRTPWSVGDTTYPAGGLLAAPFDDVFGDAPRITVLFAPDATTSLQDVSRTRDHVILTLMTDVRTRLEILTPTGDGWRVEPAAPDAVGEFNHLEVGDTDPDAGNEYLLVTTGFTQPSTLWHATVGEPVTALKREPAFFDATGMGVAQYFATSADGTRVPYFVVNPAPGGPEPVPTLLTAYGGFEISMTPYYSGVVGRGWLAKGGRLVVANIRGGGEYGPAWHQAAVKAGRERAYEDFAAVARDLVTRGLATPRTLGIEGGSNGGLLTSVMLTRHPELFGAVVTQVPLTDMRRYHLLLAGPIWMAEYGDPDDPDDWAYLSRFSPYHNVRADQVYPPVLVTTSTRDDRVHPAHARKLVARLRDVGADVTYFENMEGGHGGAADNSQRAHLSALVFDFLWRRLTT